MLFGALFTCTVCDSLGSLLLGGACRDRGVRFVSGAALLSLLVCALCAAGLVYPWVLLAVGLVAVGAGVKVNGGQRRAGNSQAALAGWTRWLWGLAFGAFAVLYLANAMAPEISPDGS